MGLQATGGETGPSAGKRPVGLPRRGSSGSLSCFFVPRWVLGVPVLVVPSGGSGSWVLTSLSLFPLAQDIRDDGRQSQAGLCQGDWPPEGKHPGVSRKPSLPCGGLVPGLGHLMATTAQGLLGSETTAFSAQVALSWLGEWRPHLTSLPSPRGAPDSLSSPMLVVLMDGSARYRRPSPSGHRVTAPQQKLPRGLSEAGLEWWRGRKTRYVARGSWCLRDLGCHLAGLFPDLPKEEAGCPRGSGLQEGHTCQGTLGWGMVIFPSLPRWLPHWSPQRQRQQNFLD